LQRCQVHLRRPYSAGIITYRIANAPPHHQRRKNEDHLKATVTIASVQLSKMHAQLMDFHPPLSNLHLPLTILHVPLVILHGQLLRIHPQLTKIHVWLSVLHNMLAFGR
jgi:hypothetical protein